ncbi:MAG: hypothetical protein V7K98_22330 [Nostoc sp.]
MYPAQAALGVGTLPLQNLKAIAQHLVEKRGYPLTTKFVTK